MIDHTQNQLVYVGDPMCSWCYGVAPEIEALNSKYGTQFPLKVVLGGLRPYETQPMDAGMKDFLRHHWEQVHERTGQEFSYDLLEPETEFIYNTEKACRAVVTVRRLQPGSEWAFFKAVQRTFYFENRDTNDPETYVSLLPQFGIEKDRFLREFDSEEARKETSDDFLWAKQVGVTGFPTTILTYENQLHALALGYSPFPTMDNVLQSILQD